MSKHTENLKKKRLLNSNRRYGCFVKPAGLGYCSFVLNFNHSRWRTGIVKHTTLVSIPLKHKVFKIIRTNLKNTDLFFLSHSELRHSIVIRALPKNEICSLIKKKRSKKKETRITKWKYFFSWNDPRLTNYFLCLNVLETYT